MSFFLEKCRHNWTRRYNALQKYQDKLILPKPAENSEPSCGFLISVRPESGLNRDQITQYIEAHTIQTRLLFAGNIIRQPCFIQAGESDKYRVTGSLERTDFIMNHTFWVGVYPGMMDKMIDHRAKIIMGVVNEV